MDFGSTLTAIASFFEDREIRYALIGGLDVFAVEQDDRVASEDWEPYRL